MMRRNALCMTLGITALCGPVTAEEDNLNLGGHVRVNYGHRDWQAPAIRDGLEFESIKLTVDGKFDDFSYKADYRWYENTDFDTVRYADLTWHYDEYLDVTGGITKVPFGLLPFASNSFWFSANYYIGFEDDYDAGVVARYERGPFTVHAGYFLNDEYNNAARFGRYSFDVADDGEYRNQEDGQYNLRVNYEARLLPRSTTDIGVSFQQGDIFNFDTQDSGDMTAYAVHLRHNQKPWKVELQYLDYRYDLAAPEGQLQDRLALSSFEAPFLMASEGQSYMANLAYSLPFTVASLEDITCYSEYSRVEGDSEAGSDSTQWVNGCSFGWSKLFVYVDSIQGKNMWFSGGSGMGLNFNDDPQSTHRLNISLGVYF
ncbi:MAG: hypothetical protein CL587_17500 [Alteromonadaceae bacterium]|nr:hypothetical protein [Alteromonadaceae bacterium]